MPSAEVDDTWSDSDEELEADIETSVQLGIPDGPLQSTSDISDPTVSRIGGHPVRCAFAPACTLSILIHYSFNPSHLSSPPLRV